MRIVAGQLGGRNFASPHGQRTRPMSEKLRGALFNTLGDIEDLTVLDAFAGSGGLAYEAISRGATQATAIDAHKAAQTAIASNIIELKLTNKVKLIKANAAAWLKSSDQFFDIIICDPPYDEPQLSLLLKIAGRAKLDGLVVLSLPPQIDFSLPETFELLSRKNYGDATLTFYRRVN
jgi:16S rRNA (guanine966-N2)-methyltransferase